MRVTIEKIVYPGKSLAYADNKVLFTDEGLPGETVEVKILRQKKNYGEGTTIEVIEPSPQRAKPQCSHYKTCAPYQYIKYSSQLEIKKKQLQEMFTHQLAIDLPSLALCPSSKIWGYRNKIDVPILWEKGTPHWAYHIPENPGAFIPVSHCALIPSLMNKLLDKLMRIIKDVKLIMIREIVVRYTVSHNEMLLVLYTDARSNSDILHHAFTSLTSAFPLKGIVVINHKNEELVLLGEDAIQETIGPVTFSIGPGSFFQINDDALKKVLSDMHHALSLTGRETVADAYCGVGTFGISLAGAARQVIGIESDTENIRFLKKNIEANTVNNFVMVKEPAEKWITRKALPAPDILMVDPPRKGLSDRVCRGILDKKPERLCYLSCNPATLMRDLKILQEGYAVRQVFAYDFFPHTPHIETMAILERKIRR